MKQDKTGTGSGKKYRIFIADYIPSLNKGETAILKGMLESYGCLGEIDVAILSRYPEVDIPRYGSRVRTVDINQCWHLHGEFKTRFGKIWASIRVMFQLKDKRLLQKL